MEADAIDQMKALTIVESANVILQSNSKMEMLPNTLIEIINEFLNALPTSTEKELLVSALRRVLLQQVQPLENDEEVIQALLPLLLDSSLSLRTQTALCLLQSCSMATTAILDLQLSSISRHIFLALASVSSNLAFTASSPGLLRFVETCFQIYITILDKVSFVTPEIVNSLITNLVIWIYHSPGRGGASTPLVGRGRATSGASLASSFGVMGSFAPSSPKKRESVVRSSSRSSINGAMSESEDESASTEKKYSSANVRCSALLVLKSVALHDSKLLFGHWSHFFADSPYLRSQRTLLGLIESDPSSVVRLRACQTLNAMLNGSATYLAIADDRVTKASFTSLSSRLGETTHELHSKLASLLASPSSSNDPSLRIAMLNVARTLGKNSPYLRLKRPLLGVLVQAILPYLRHEVENVREAAGSALVYIIDNNYGGFFPSPQILDLNAIGSTTIQVLETSQSNHLISILWKVLSVVATRADQLDLTPALIILERNHGTASLDTLESQIPFVASLFKVLPSIVDLSPFVNVILTVTKLALKSSQTSSRILGCGILASSKVEELGLGLDAVTEALKLSEDEDVGVRSAACRSLGLLVKSKTCQSETEFFKTIIDRLMICCTQNDSTKGSASWALANCCDSLTMNNSRSIDIPSLIELNLELASSTNTEKIHTNGIRALGSLLRISDPSLKLDSKTSRIVATLCEGNQVGGSAKLRWNSAAAIGNALTGDIFSTPSTSLTVSNDWTLERVKLIQSLSSTLVEDGNFKVRIQAVNSLLVLNRRELFGMKEEFEEVSEKVRLAIEKSKEESDVVPAKEKDHLEQLWDKLDRCSNHLAALREL